MCAGRVIPKEELTKIERWEIGPFGNSRNKKDEPAEPPVKLPTAAEVEALQRQAHEEGYQAGLAEARAEAERLRGLSQSFSTSISEVEKAVAEQLLNLSIDIAQQVIREALAVKPELVLPVVREALNALSESRQNNVIRLNPKDVELVSRHLGDELSLGGWKIFADESIGVGGCRLESANGEVNATLASRWQRVISTLGREDGWIK